MNKKLSLLLASSIAFSSDVIAFDNNINSLKTENSRAKEYSLKFSIDNKSKYSQNTISDLTFSMISGLGYVSEEANLNSNLGARLGMAYLALLTTTLNHELTGHALRAKELGQKVTEVKLNLDGSGETSFNWKKEYNVQKDTLISLGGVQANYLLAQKISSDLISRNQKMDPVTGTGYIFSSLDQTIYSQHIDNSSGNDMQAYIRDMELMYGEGSMTKNKIQSATWLNILDPVLFASAKSLITGENEEIPQIKIWNVGIAPFAAATLTPYGSIEKKFGSYIITDYTPIRISFGFGKQNKTSESATPTTKEFDILAYLKKTGAADLNKIDYFDGLNPGETPKKHNTYVAECTIYKIISFDKLNIGASGAIWKQPEFNVLDPYRAKPKHGGMLLLTSTYNINDRINISLEGGYKTKGFIPGEVIAKTPIIRAGLELKL